MPAVQRRFETIRAGDRNVPASNEDVYCVPGASQRIHKRVCARLDASVAVPGLQRDVKALMLRLGHVPSPAWYPITRSVRVIVRTDATCVRVRAPKAGRRVTPRNKDQPFGGTPDVEISLDVRRRDRIARGRRDAVAK